MSYAAPPRRLSGLGLLPGTTVYPVTDGPAYTAPSTNGGTVTSSPTTTTSAPAPSSPTSSPTGPLAPIPAGSIPPITDAGGQGVLPGPSPAKVVTPAPTASIPGWALVAGGLVLFLVLRRRA